MQFYYACVLCVTLGSPLPVVAYICARKAEWSSCCEPTISS
jgi:hypothetical protein